MGEPPGPGASTPAFFNEQIATSWIRVDLNRATELIMEANSQSASEPGSSRYALHL